LSGPFVLDASMTLSWAFEVASVLTVAERRGRINTAQQADFLERLRLLPVMIEHRPAVWLGQRILPLARAYRLSAYDAAYLDLAIRDSLPLATLDGDLRTAALAAGVPLLTEEV
jgi:predicted nucleic acid-binding protein